MKFVIKRQIKVTMELSQEEAIWLKNICQNPITAADSTFTEDEKDFSMRKRFFEGLKKNLENIG